MWWWIFFSLFFLVSIVLSITLFFYLTGETLQLIQHKLKIISPTWGNQFSIRAFALILKKIRKF